MITPSKLMFSRSAAIVTTALVLAACAPVPPEQPVPTIPASVIAIADPRQDLTTAELRPQDNCYWYLHANPVETTLLPLRTVDGRPICAG